MTGETATVSSALSASQLGYVLREAGDSNADDPERATHNKPAPAQGGAGCQCQHQGTDSKQNVSSSPYFLG